MYYVYSQTNLKIMEVFYIGCGSLYRIKKINRPDQPLYQDYVKRYGLKRKDVESNILFKTISKEEAHSVEDAYIHTHKNTIVNKGTNKEILKVAQLTSASNPENARKRGHLGGSKTKERGVGIFAQTKEQRQELGRRSGQLSKQNKTGIFSLTKEQQSAISRKMANRPESIERMRTIGKSNIGKGNKKIICLTDGKTFDSLKVAADFYNLHSCNITLACQGVYKRTGKKEFRYIEEDKC